MAVKQEYPVGEYFNAYYLSDLTADSAAGYAWSWSNRSLSGFMNENRDFIPQGGILKYDEPTAQVSGVWTLDKSSHVLSIFGLGRTGRVNVKITETSKIKPLANESHPYEHIREHVLDGNNRAIVLDDIYWQGVGEEYNGFLSIELSCEQGTTIKRVACGQIRQDTGFSSNNLINIYGWDKSNCLVEFPDGSYPIYNDYIWQYGISVDFTQNGILSYYSNKDYINPNPQQ